MRNYNMGITLVFVLLVIFYYSLPSGPAMKDILQHFREFIWILIAQQARRLAQYATTKSGIPIPRRLTKIDRIRMALDLSHKARNLVFSIPQNNLEETSPNGSLWYAIQGLEEMIKRQTEEDAKELVERLKHYARTIMYDS